MNVFLPMAVCATLALGISAAAPVDAEGAEASEANQALTGQELARQLSEEDRARLRIAVQEVWSDEKVRAAREELQRATRAFRASLREAIRDQEDPELKRVMNGLLAEHYAQESKELRADLRIGADGASKQRPKTPPRDRKASPLSAEEQAMLERVREAAVHEPEVLQAIRERETAVDHRSKMVAAGNYRKAMRAAMLRLEPQMAGVFKKLEGVHRAPGKGE